METDARCGAEEIGPLEMIHNEVGKEPYKR